MNESEFAAAFRSLLAMPETQDAELYARLKQFLKRQREHPPRVIVGADVPPSECHECHKCRPDLCNGHEMLDLAKEYQKRWPSSSTSEAKPPGLTVPSE